MNVAWRRRTVVGRHQVPRPCSGPTCNPSRRVGQRRRRCTRYLCSSIQATVVGSHHAGAGTKRQSWSAALVRRGAPLNIPLGEEWTLPALSGSARPCTVHRSYRCGRTSGRAAERTDGAPCVARNRVETPRGHTSWTSGGGARYFTKADGLGLGRVPALGRALEVAPPPVSHHQYHHPPNQPGVPVLGPSRRPAPSKGPHRRGLEDCSCASLLYLSLFLCT